MSFWKTVIGIFLRTTPIALLSVSAHAQFMPGTLLKIDSDSESAMRGGEYELKSSDGTIKIPIVHKGGKVKIHKGAEIGITGGGGILGNAQNSKGIIEVGETFTIKDKEIYRLIRFRDGKPSIVELKVDGADAKRDKIYLEDGNFINLRSPKFVLDLVIERPTDLKTVYLGIGAFVAVVALVMLRLFKPNQPKTVGPDSIGPSP